MSDLLVLGHGHHNVLLSWDLRYEVRKQEILEFKPKRERAIRLRHMWQVTPEQLADLPPAVDEAYRVWDEARRALVEADRVWDEARRALVEADRAWVEAGRAWDEARRAWDEARRALDEAGRAWDEAQRTHRAALEAWHTRHCPALHSPEGCQWDGERLVGVGE